MSQQDGLDTDKLSAVHTESSLLSFIILTKIPCINKMKYMHLHELLYFFNIHLNLSNKALRRGQRRKQMHVTYPFLVFFTLQITDSNKRLGHPKKRLIIYRVSKGMCRRQLETAQGFAMFSTSVRKRVEVKKTNRTVRGVLPGSCRFYHPTPPDAPWMEGTHLEKPPSHLENTCQVFP